MVMHWRGALAAAVVVTALGAGTTCKVINEEHCANQSVPGNEFCIELSTATPYCSPCRRDFQGCVDFEPFACPGYADEMTDEQLEDDGTPMESSTTDEVGSSSGETPGSTSDDGMSGSGSSSSSGSDSGSSTTSG